MKYLIFHKSLESKIEIRVFKHACFESNQINIDVPSGMMRDVGHYFEQEKNWPNIYKGIWGRDRTYGIWASDENLALFLLTFS